MSKQLCSLQSGFGHTAWASQKGQHAGALTVPILADSEATKDLPYKTVTCCFADPNSIWTLGTWDREATLLGLVPFLNFTKIQWNTTDFPGLEYGA